MRSAVFALQRLRLVVTPVVKARAEAVQVVRQCPARPRPGEQAPVAPPPETSSNAICKLERALRKTIVSSLVRLPRVFSLNHFELIDEHPGQIRLISASLVFGFGI
jgi:hypothetical protein